MTRLLLCAALLIAAGSAAAQRTIEYVEGAYELALREVDLPPNVVGALTFKTCDSCMRISLSTTADTQYSFVDGRALTFADFSATVTRIRQTAAASRTGVNLFYDLATKQVTRVILLPAE
jgi:hypothetical protein